MTAAAPVRTEVSVGLPTTVPGLTGADLVDWARRIERCGFAGLGVLDRLVYDSYDALVALTAAAAVTDRVRLTTTVLLAAYRGAPAVLAKQLATIDHLSGHRLVVGVAAGGRPDDFEVAGRPFGRRGRELDRALVDMRRVWGGADGIGPRPTADGIPLLVGGHSDAALRRAAEHASGWIAGGSSASSFGDLVARARDHWAAAGRPGRPRTVALAYVALGPDRAASAGAYFRDYYAYVGPKAEALARGVLADPSALRDTVAGYAAAGCDELVLMPCTADPGQVDEMAEALA